MMAAPSLEIKRVLARCAKAGFSQRRMEEAKYILEKAEGDCLRLDESETPPGNFFVKNFHAGLAEDNAVRLIHGFLDVPMDGRSRRMFARAKRDGEVAANVANFMHHLKELVRDRWPIEIALKSIPAKFVQERLTAGDAAFFEKLGRELEMMRRHPERSLRGYESWIVRAWLPLWLWRFDRADEAWPLLRRAAEANGMQELARTIGSPPSRQFVRAWSNARNR